MRPLARAGLAGGVLLGLCAAGLAGTYATMRLGWWDTNLAAMQAKYAAAPDYFVTVDGVPLHVSDEGKGPVVVMLHGSIVSLHEWDPTVARLKDRYRIIRFDWPPYGISAPDPTKPETITHDAQLMAGLVDALHLQKFSIVATSNGGNVALSYIASHPEHVIAAAFSILPLHRPSQTRKTGGLLKDLAEFHQAYLPDYHEKLFYRLLLEDTTHPGFAPPPALVDMMYDMDNLPGAQERQRAYLATTVHDFKTTDVAALAGDVHVPVLLQWCMLDTVISQSAASTVASFSQAPVQLIEYKTAGHFPMWEIPDQFAGDLGAFLDRVNAQ